MSSDLESIIKNYTDDFLLSQFYHENDNYTPEALDLMKKEIASRNISQDIIKNYENTASTEQHYEKDEFLPLENLFSHTDMMLLYSIFSEHNIPFYTESTSTSEIVPVDTEMTKTYKIYVHEDSFETAKNSIQEHFKEAAGLYALKEMSTFEKLKSVNFFELRLSDSQLEESIQIELTSKEKQVIISYAQKVLDDVDAIEEKLERPFFYYDNIEELIDLLKNNSSDDFLLAHLCAILEVLQIYCDDDSFPADMEQTIKGLLQFIETIADN